MHVDQSVPRKKKKTALDSSSHLDIRARSCPKSFKLIYGGQSAINLDPLQPRVEKKQRQCLFIDPSLLLLTIYGALLHAAKRFPRQEGSSKKAEVTAFLLRKRLVLYNQHWHLPDAKRTDRFRMGWVYTAV